MYLYVPTIGGLKPHVHSVTYTLSHSEIELGCLYLRGLSYAQDIVVFYPHAAKLGCRLCVWNVTMPLVKAGPLVDMMSVPG